jgi:hypothetical protein
VVHPLGELDRSSTGSEQDAEPPALLEGQRVGLDAGVVQRLARRGDRQGHGAGHVPDILGLEMLRGMEVLDLAGDRGRETFGIEQGDPAHTARALTQGTRIFLAPVAVGREAANPGDRDAPLNHARILCGARARPRND